MKQSFTGLFLAFFSVALWASVQAKITPEAVDLGQSVQFIISVDNFQQGDVPDLSGLHQDFTVLGTREEGIFLEVIGDVSNDVVVCLESSAGSDRVVSIKILQNQLISLADRQYFRIQLLKDNGIC